MTTAGAARLTELDGSDIVETGVDADESIKNIAHKIAVVPEGFNMNPKMVGQLARRAKMGEGALPIDWAFAEAVAFGSLVLEGTRVRLSGQDSGRGTFSQRHAVLYDTQTGQTLGAAFRVAIASQPGARFDVFDSSLSEEGVLGFEYGYSVVAQDALVLWEAQFGDFGNGAQTIIDQYIAASEDKWKQTSRLTMLLPHGYEGQGPGTFERAARTFPATLRRKQSAGLLSDDAGAVFSSAAAPDKTRNGTAARRDDAQESAASAGGDFDRCSANQRRLPTRD